MVPEYLGGAKVGGSGADIACVDNEVASETVLVQFASY